MSKSTFQPAGAELRDASIHFLAEVFQATGTEPGLSLPQMRWKYEDPAEHAWTCRNYAIVKDGKVLAHAGVWPARMMYGAHVYSGAHLIDWAGAKDAPGAGVSLLQRISRMEQIVYGLGGSEMTRRIFPAFGFHPIATIGYYARPLHPFRQVLRHQHRRSWKSPARLVRNWWWSRIPSTDTGTWSAQRLDEVRVHTVWPSSTETVAVFRRDAGAMEYLARCPVAQSRFYQVRNGTAAVGYFVLVFVPGQVRIADTWLTDAGSVEAWEKLFTLAEATSMQYPEALEIVTIAGLPAARAALRKRGLQQVKEEELLAYDPGKVLPAGVDVHFQLVDNDACYMHGGVPMFWT